MGDADRRIAELLDRWLASVDRHTGYLDLDDAAYARVQDWPRHQRPTRWVVELARARLLELRRQAGERRDRGDAAYFESLELMSLLTNLLGSEHLERFIPLAGEPAASAESAARPDAPAAAARPASSRPAGATAAAARAKLRATSKSPRPETPPRPDRVAAMVIADAVRLLSWGREWPQLAGLIARIADRPPEKDVWTILRAHRAAIEAKARHAPQ
jgi:hypothetical protein